MGVKIDETRRDGQTRRIDNAVSATAHASDLDDTITANSDIACAGRQTTAVIDAATFDYQIESHIHSPCLCYPGVRRPEPFSVEPQFETNHKRVSQAYSLITNVLNACQCKPYNRVRLARI